MYRVTKAGRNYIHKFIPYIIQYRWWKTYVINVLFVGNISEVSLIFVYAHWFKINIILNTSTSDTRWSQEDRMLFNFCLFICYPFKRTMDIVIEKYLFSCIQRISHMRKQTIAHAWTWRAMLVFLGKSYKTKISWQRKTRSRKKKAEKWMMAPVLLTKKSRNVVERKKLLFAVDTGE